MSSSIVPGDISITQEPSSQQEDLPPDMHCDAGSPEKVASKGSHTAARIHQFLLVTGNINP